MWDLIPVFFTNLLLNEQTIFIKLAHWLDLPLAAATVLKSDAMTSKSHLMLTVSVPHPQTMTSNVINMRQKKNISEESRALIHKHYVEKVPNSERFSDVHEYKKPPNETVFIKHPYAMNCWLILHDLNSTRMLVQHHLHLNTHMEIPDIRAGIITKRAENETKKYHQGSSFDYVVCWKLLQIFSFSN